MATQTERVEVLYNWSKKMQKRERDMGNRKKVESVNAEAKGRAGLNVKKEANPKQGTYAQQPQEREVNPLKPEAPPQESEAEQLTDLFDIMAEIQIFTEIKDIMDELHILTYINEQQKKAWTEFRELVYGNKEPFRRLSQLWESTDVLQRLSIDAKRTYDAVGKFLE
jgi:hypothetical protein